MHFAALSQVGDSNESQPGTYWRNNGRRVAETDRGDARGLQNQCLSFIRPVRLLAISDECRVGRNARKSD